MKIWTIHIMAMVIVILFCAEPSEAAPSPRTESIASPAIGALVHIPAGSFLRDGNPGNVSFVSGFYMSQHEITVAQFAQIMYSRDSGESATSGGTASYPASGITWYQAIAFCNRLSIRENLEPVYSVGGSKNPDDWGSPPGRSPSDWDRVTADWSANGYRLPTEMEWRWAAMGADSQAAGETNASGYSLNFAGQELGLDKQEASWCAVNSSGKAHPVGSRKASALGLYDMTGNVWEWNWDWLAPLPTGRLDDYRGQGNGRDRTLHGGSWRNQEDRCNNTFRLGHEPEFVFQNIGFRVVRKEVHMKEVDMIVKAPIYQLRIYKIFKHNKQAFHERFRDHAARLMAHHGFSIVSMWEAESENKFEFIYLLKWPDKITMRERWRAFMADRQWEEIKEVTSAAHGLMVGGIEEKVMRNVIYSPDIRTN